MVDAHINTSCSSTNMIDILIPTFNRSVFLIRNIRHLDDLVKKENLFGRFRVIISNNASTDDTSQAIEAIKNEVAIDLEIYHQEVNLGLERNAVFVLEKARSKYVVILGDDDWLPEDYLTKLSEVAESGRYGVVIPGFSALSMDGVVSPGRDDLTSRAHGPGFEALMDFSCFGHQLSGLFFEREGVVHAYKSDEKNRNIYLFIFFIGYVMQRKASLYVPEFQVLVTEGNAKDWSYDKSGLLTEVFKNFNALYPDDRRKRVKLCKEMMMRQHWRMRLGRNPLGAVPSLVHLIKSDSVDMYLKWTLPFFYAFLYSRLVVRALRRKFTII